MSPASHREFATALLIDPAGRFLLQQRDDIPGILFPGWIGPFGGQREGDETFLQCVVRELHEETGAMLAPGRFEGLLSYDGADPELEGGTVRAECYLVRGVGAASLVVTEGKLLVAAVEDIPALMARLTPWGRLAIAKHLNSNLPD
jgi:8-oxo-dGTP pyrophosphatase MutT (NUDIX family)